MFGSALAEAAAATGRRDWAEAAVRVGEFLLAELRPAGSARWLRSWQDGRARHLAYAGDYAWLVDFFTRLAELTGRAVWLDHARATALAMLELFGGDGALLYTTGHDAEPLVVRPMEILDGAIPAASGVAAAALLRLGALRADDGLTGAGESLARALAPVATRHPLASANSLAACELAGGGVTEVVVTGDRADLLATVRSQVRAVGRRGLGRAERRRRCGPDGDDGLAYVCRRSVCRAPASTALELVRRLEDETAQRPTRMEAARP